MEDFREFIVRREKAAQAYCRGDASKVEMLATGRDPATFFAPDGRILRGAEVVRQDYSRGAGQFGPGGDSSLEVFHFETDGGLAYWTGLQHATLEIQGKKIPMKLRITEVFRREGEDWKLLHRHADIVS